MKRLDQTGSHVIVIAVAVLVVALIGFAGYRVAQSDKTTADTGTTAHAAPVSKTSPATVPATIKSSADLTQAAEALDNASSQLNSSLDDSSLNAALNAML